MTLSVTMLERRDPFSNLPQPIDPRGNLVPRLGMRQGALMYLTFTIE